MTPFYLLGAAVLALTSSCSWALPVGAHSGPLVVAADDDWSKQQIWMRRGQDAVRAKLKDGDSAKFKDVYFHRGKDRVPVTCGQVNAKNSFGAYIGFQHFASAGTVEHTYLESEVKDFAVLWRALCTGKPKPG